MKPVIPKSWNVSATWVFIIIFGFAATDALGADAAVTWRPTYDLVMRWFNFGIMIVLFFRYARKPLTGFLNGKSRQIKEKLTRIEEEKELIQTRVSHLLNEREESRERLEQIRSRFISQGKMKKQKIIDDATNESRLLMESARRKIEYEIIVARDRLQAEMVDQAIDLSLQKLPLLMTDQDTQNRLNVYLDGIHDASES